ncbi:MAG: type II toxin-antitoxin system VapC family toxin [Terracidiphilus sp.]|jgi:predicted nucleic acid-binding protein
MIYLDSSLLFSVHSADINSREAVRLLQAASEPLAVTQLCPIEVINALSLRIFRGEITIKQAQDSISDLEKNLRSGIFGLRPFPENTFTRARSLAQMLTPVIGARSADLLHVAAALELGCNSLYSFDRKQRLAAQSAGLIVNPLP